MGDPQTDGQENVETEVYFSFNSPLLATGLKADISGLDANTAYSVALGEFIAYLENPPPEPEPEPDTFSPPTGIGGANSGPKNALESSIQGFGNRKFAL